ncbi:hypothetical protein NSTC731_05254 [Nostoc sp. DSM 114167]|jgi:hypothetical protein
MDKLLNLLCNRLLGICRGKGEGGAPEGDKGPGWFHTKKEKYISLDFSYITIDFDPTSIPLPVGVSLPLGKRREALKSIFSFSLVV